MGRPRIILRPTPVLAKQLGQFKKLFGLWEKNKWKGNKINPDLYRKEGVPDFLAQRKGLDTKFITRRQIVMNRHFTEILSDVLSNSMKKTLAELGVIITSIETKAWNKGVDVFYYTDDGFNSEKQQQLVTFIKELRSSVTERRLIGRTPIINFVLDRTIACDKKIDQAFDKAKEVTKETEPSQLTEFVKDTSLKTVRKAVSDKSDLNPHLFSAPNDMTNTMFGLDYSSLYDHVASKLERGRALSTRTRPSDKVVLTTPPVLRGPVINSEEEDPMTRIVNMQKFLINQRKKSERLSKQRRLEEILARNASRWDSFM